MNVIVPEVLDCLPSLKEKYLVDFVNGIDTAKDQVAVQKSRQPFFNRLTDSINGNSSRRQSHINDQLLNGLEGSFRWLSELTEGLTFTNHALKIVTQDLTGLKEKVAKIANFSADTRELLNNFSSNVEERFSIIDSRVTAVDMRQKAYQQVDSLFSQWRSGQYQQLTIAECCYVVLNELAWGVCGEYLRFIATKSDKQELLRYLKTEMIVHINEQTKVSSGQRLSGDVYISYRNEGSDLLINEFSDAIAYLATEISPENQPFTYFITQKPKERPLEVPYRMNTTRLVDALFDELTKDGALYV